MTTLAIMKARIADELARSDLTSQIATAINDAIIAYQTDRLFFNSRTSVVAPPVSDGEAGNLWMTTAERLIRARAKRELALHWVRDVELAKAMEVAEQAAIAELRLRATTAPGTPGTLGGMKSTIADDIGRDDLTLQIANAISTAIVAYQTDRFFFNESRSACTFNTVAAQQDYTSAANANIPDLLAIDYVALTVGSTVTMLDQYTPESIEDLTNNQSAVGEPYAYCYYNRLIRLYPIPGQAYPVRIAAHVKIAAPASDGEANNPWMVEAERLIRSRAKLELAAHVIKDSGMAAAMAAAVEEAEGQLKGRTNRQAGTGRVTPSQF